MAFRNLAPAITALVCFACAHDAPAKTDSTAPVVAGAGSGAPTVYVDSGTSEAYIDSIFTAQLGDDPTTGWLVPPGRFVAHDWNDTAFVYSAGGYEAVPFAAAVDSVARLKLSKQHTVACNSSDSLAEYRVGHPVSRAAMVMFSDTREPGPVQAGAHQTTLTDAVRRDAQTLLRGDTVRLGLFRDTAVSISPDLPFYSFHLGYDSAKAVRRTAILLHAPDGRIIGAHVTSIDPEEGCEGCQPIPYSEGIDGYFKIVNVFSLPGFRYPVLQREIAGGEGRSIALATFSPTGRLSEISHYENLVSCVLGRDR